MATGEWRCTQINQHRSLDAVKRRCGGGGHTAPTPARITAGPMLQHCEPVSAIRLIGANGAPISQLLLGGFSLPPSIASHRITSLLAVSSSLPSSSPSSANFGCSFRFENNLNFKFASKNVNDCLQEKLTLNETLLTVPSATARRWWPPFCVLLLSAAR